jgi:hypothetical protein
VDGCETAVAGDHTVVAVVFEVVEERGDERRVEFGDVERAGGLGGAFGGEADEEPEAGLVGGDGVGAGVALADQAVGEEGLEGGGERAHRGAPKRASSRSAARPISSGEADRYQ